MLPGKLTRMQTSHHGIWKGKLRQELQKKLNKKSTHARKKIKRELPRNKLNKSADARKKIKRELPVNKLRLNRKNQTKSSPR